MKLPQEFGNEMMNVFDNLGDCFRALESHADLTIKLLEQNLKRRGNSYQSRGKTIWELQLLYSAYCARNIPVEDRKFGLDKINDISQINREMRF